MLPSTEHVVEHVDTDAQGVVHFTRYLSLAETAVLRGLERLGVGGRGSGDGTSGATTIVTTQARYHAPARFADTLRVDGHVREVGGARFSVCARVTKVPDETVAATALLGLCFVDHAGRPRALGLELRALLEAAQASPDQHEGGAPCPSR